MYLVADYFMEGGIEYEGKGTYRVAEPTDLPHIVEAYRLGFGFSDDRSARYVEDVGLNQFRLLEVEGRPAAILALIDSGHWFGGRAVPALNVAHVAVNPEWRGRRVAGLLLEGCFSEARSRGIGLITLFASTRPVYRRLGFALAGSEVIYEADTRRLPRRRDAGFEPLADDQQQVVVDIYRAASALDAGLLDRSAAHWAAIFGGRAKAYLSRGDRSPAYVILDTSDPACLKFCDWGALDGDGAERILSFASTFASVYPKIQWHGSAQDRLVYAMPDKGWDLVHQEEWLAKVIDLPAVLTSRGYGAFDAELGVDIRSDGGTSSYILSLRDGTAECVRGSRNIPTILISADDLGSLVTGHRTAHFLAQANVIEAADPKALVIADQFFSGPPPWVGEHF